MKKLLFLIFFSTNSHSTFYKDIITTPLFAEEVAYVYIKNVYGESTALRQKPYRITESENEWIIEGRGETDRAGGSCFIKIVKKNGEIKSLFHSK